MDDFLPDINEPDKRGDAWQAPRGPITRLVAWLILALIGFGTLAMIGWIILWAT
jgi:hypothetical protein